LTKRLTISLLARAALACGLAQAAGANAMNLQQAYDAALANDPTYRGAIQEKKGGDENEKLGRSTLLPNVSASYSANRNRADLLQETFLGPQLSHPQYNSHSTVVQVRQPIFSWDAWARYKQGKAQTQYSGALFDVRSQELVLRVAGAYTDALFAEDQLRLAEVQRDAYLEQKNVNERLFTKGEGTKTDMLETQSRLDLAEAQVLEAKDNVQTTRATLAGIVGQDVTGLSELRTDFRLQQLPAGGFEDLKRAALELNPQIVAQNYAIEAARQEVNKARAGHTPRIDFIGTYSKGNAETLNTYTQESTNRSIGVQVNIPIYSGGQVNASSRQAVAGMEKAKADKDAKTDQILVELRKQYAAVVSSSARINALDKAVDSAKLLVKATELSIKGGVRINLDLLNAQQQLYTSQRDRSQARFNYLNSLLKLRAAAGTLSPDDVREISLYFQ
jgi:protease secretion system outer membrane protein